MRTRNDAERSGACGPKALSSYFAFGRVINWGRRDGTGNPLATVYRCKDGKAFWLTGFEADRHWPSTVRAVGQPDWLDDSRFKTARARRENQRQLVAELDRVFASKTREEWAVQFDAEGVWWAPVLTAAEATCQKTSLWPAVARDAAAADQVAADPQAIAAGSFVESPLSSKAEAAGRTKAALMHCVSVDGVIVEPLSLLIQVTMVASPVDFLNAPKTGPRRATPELGEQTEAQGTVQRLLGDSDFRISGPMRWLRAPARWTGDPQRAESG